MKTHKPIVIHIVSIILLTSIFYYPALTNDFTWDDDDYILNNFSIQRAEGLKDIWFGHKTPQYYPVVFTSFWIEYHLWGARPLGYHIVNLLFHILNALLIYALLSKLYRPIALPAALIFALHPVHVETVAWITERKNIYAALFYLLAVFNYIRFHESNRKRDYVSSFLCFALALLSKSITVTFVMVPLLIRWWQHQRIKPMDVIRLIPFGLIGILAGLNTIYYETVWVGAKGNTWSLPLLGHFVLPGKILVFYIYKLIFPLRIMFIYPRWDIDPSNVWQWLPVCSIVALLALFYIYKDKIGRGAFAAFFFYIVSLFPVLGFFNVYSMMYSYVSDHHQYIASIGMIIFLCGTGELALKHAVLPQGRLNAKHHQVILWSPLVLILLIFGLKIFSYSHAFESRETLFADIIQKNPKAWMARNNLGLVYISKGEISKALDQYRETLKIKPDDCVALTNMGSIYREQGLWEKAKTAYETCLQSDPAYATAYNNLGLVYVHSGDLRHAEEFFEKAVSLDPMAHAAHLNLGRLFFQQKAYDKSLMHFKKAIEIHPFYIDAYLQMGLLYAQMGETKNAEIALQKVLQIDPQQIHAHNNLGILYRRENRLEAAADQFRKALQLDPEFIQARYNLGETLLNLGQKQEAFFHFSEIERKGVKLPQPIERFLREKNP
jgi:tetratricopeptide (TPR) repeat protein